MKADTLNAKDLFEKNVRYVVPTFQRPYVWKQEDQWEPLWIDVQNAAERYLDALEEAEDDWARAESLAGRHFLGAIVVQQELTGAAEIETRNVIDGQQRLTTLQLLIDAAQEVAEESGWEDIAEGLNDLVLNNKRYARKDPDHIFKLWPTATDRAAFRAAMANGADTDAHGASQITNAHEYFKLRIADWAEAATDDAERERRIHALETALLGLLELVVIDLGSSDDAFVIFETLNARGTPLRPSDLVKNFIMQTVAAAGGSPDDVHGRYWIRFEHDDWWQDDIRQGRLTRPRIDVFLDYWLELATVSEVASHEVFPRFQAFVESGGVPITDVAGQIQRAGATYRSIEATDPWSPDGIFLYRWRTMDVGTSTPLLIWLFGQPESALSENQRLEFLKTLESYLIRRMVGRMTTKDYNRFFLDVLERLVSHDPAEAPARLRDYLIEQTADSRLWPTDADFVRDLSNLPLYRLLTRPRLRMMLEALEDSYRGPKSEDQFVTRSKLTVEHVLPQKWREHWPLPPTDDPTLAGLERDRTLHSLGNLTLVTKSLNPALSNSGWETKRDALGDHTVLMLNKKLLSGRHDEWAETQIAERAGELAARAVEIWPRGTAT